MCGASYRGSRNSHSGSASSGESSNAIDCHIMNPQTEKKTNEIDMRAWGVSRANLHSRETGDVGLAEEEVMESRRSKLVPYGLLSSSSFHMLPTMGASDEHLVDAPMGEQ